MAVDIYMKVKMCAHETLPLLSGVTPYSSSDSLVKVAWPSGLRRWFKAPVSSEAWVRIPPLPTHIFESPLMSFLLSLRITRFDIEHTNLWNQRPNGLGV